MVVGSETVESVELMLGLAAALHGCREGWVGLGVAGWTMVSTAAEADVLSAGLGLLSWGDD